MIEKQSPFVDLYYWWLPSIGVYVLYSYSAAAAASLIRLYANVFVECKPFRSIKKKKKKIEEKKKALGRQSITDKRGGIGKTT